MTTISDLETIVRTQIRDNGTTLAFQNTELDQFIQDAIAQYSRVRARKRPYTLSLVAGTDTYTLPTDWIRVDGPSFQHAVNPDPQLGLLGIYGYEYNVMMYTPSNLSLRNTIFDWYNSDQTLITRPAPQSDFTLQFDYFAQHQADASSCTLPAEDLYAAMWWASAQALYALAIDKSGKLLIYKAKDVDVNNEASVQSLKAEADALIQRWEKWLLRPQGKRAGDLSKMDWGLSYNGPWGSPL